MKKFLSRIPLIFGIFLVTTASHCPWHDADPCEDNPVGANCESGYSKAKTLPIAPIAQQTPVWCWAATAEMVFRYYSVPNLNQYGNYQCGIVAVYFGGQCAQNCGLCVAPIQGMAQLNLLINDYDLVARQLGVPSPDVRSQIRYSALEVSEVAREIEAGRPIIAGITAGGFPFPNFSQHVVVIVGYDLSGSEPYLIVNDPFPYNFVPGAGNPYMVARATEIQPGQYRISVAAFKGYMAWGNSIVGIQT
jgi:hypothetical protein